MRLWVVQQVILGKRARSGQERENSLFAEDCSSEVRVCVYTWSFILSLVNISVYLASDTMGYVEMNEHMVFILKEHYFHL